MKKTLLLLDKVSVERGRADPEGLVRVLNAGAKRQDLAVAYEYAFFEDLVYTIDSNRASIIDTITGKDVATYDLVYFRRWGHVAASAMATAIYLSRKGITCIDQEAHGVGSKNKLTQPWRLWEAGLRCPTTVYGAKGKAQDWILEHLDELPFGFPMIIKGLEATRGSDNYLVHDEAELRAKLQEHADVEFLLQEFIPNDCDYRVIVCGDTVRFVLRRTAVKGKHTNNTSQGGSAELVDLSYLSAQVAADCVHAAQAFSRDFAGVDLVYHKETGEHLFFEVNRSPQIESGSYIAEKADVLSRYLYEASA